MENALTNTIKNTATKVKSNLSNPTSFVSSIADAAMNNTVLNPKKAKSWRDDDGYWWNNGFRYGKDYNGDGRFQTNEVDPSFYKNVVENYENNERQILTTGRSSIGPSTWDEAEQQGVISHAEAERGRASNQTFLDGRMGAGYVVEHKHAQGEDPLEGAAKDQFYNELEASQGMPTAQALAIANDSKKRGRENYLANGVTDVLKDQVEYTGDTWNPFVMQDGVAVDRVDAVANANANLMAEEGIRALTRQYGGEVNGSTAMDLPAGSYIVDMDSVVFDEDKGRFVHEVKDGSFNTTDGKNALYARVSGEAPSLLGSAAAREDAGLFSDILSAPQEGIQWLSSKMRVADDAIAPFVNKVLPNFPHGLNEESWNGYDRKSVEEDLINVGNTFNFAKEEDGSETGNFVFSNREDAIEEFLLANPNFNIEETELIPVIGYNFKTKDGTDLGYVSASEVADPFSWAATKSHIISPNGTKLYFTNQKNVYSYNQDQSPPFVRIEKEFPVFGEPSSEDAFGWVPVPSNVSLNTDWETVIKLASGEGVDYTEAGWGGQSPDLFNDDGHLNYKNVVTHPSQTAKFLGNMLVESSPYMLGSAGLVAAGSDSIAGLRGFNSFKEPRAGVTPGYHRDPGLMQQDEYWGNWASVTGEGATESLLGIGAGTLAKAGYRAKKAKEVEEAVDPAVAYAAAMGKKNPIKDSATAGVVGDILRMAAGEGIEEAPAGALNQLEKGGWIDPESPLGISSDLGNVGRSVAYDEFGNPIRTPWGSYTYDQSESTSDRVTNAGREILDAMTLGALAGGGLGTLTKSPQLAEAIKTDIRSAKTGRDYSKNVSGLKEETLQAIRDNQALYSGKGD